jgi:uncharacterized membrane protein
MLVKFSHLIILVVLASFASIIYGFSIKSEQVLLGHRFIGGGTVGLFLVAMPLFLIKESRGKQLKDYMLTKENIEKMQNQSGEKTENQ